MFRFTIRDVLWLTVVVAVICVNWIDREIWRRNQKAELERGYAEYLEVAEAFGGKDKFAKIAKAFRGINQPIVSPPFEDPFEDPAVRKSGRPLPPGQVEAEPGVFFLQ